MIQSNLRILAIVIWGSLILVHNVFAQDLRDHIGREFFVVFGPNTGGEPDVETKNSLTLTVVSADASNVRIEIPSLSFDSSVHVDERASLTVDLPNGNNGTPTAALTRSDNARQLKGRAIHVSADADIAVYARNQKLYSEDVFLVFPVRSLGSDYRVVSYQTSSPGQGLDMPGQFIVVAVEDGTEISITPTCLTFDRKLPNVPFDVSLDRGDSYLMLSSLDAGNDLTGSRITGNKPIAVFSGHERAAIPGNATLFDGSGPSRDHLFEQLPPIAACGDSFFVVPFATSQRPDLVRVIATSDSTEIVVNGTPARTIKDGEFFEINQLHAPAMITTSKPALVAQYMGSALGRLNDPDFPAQGDPAMMLVAPVEQFLSAYAFHTFGFSADASSYVSIILPAASYSSTLIDGKGLDLVQTIAGSDYVHTTQRVTPGRHVISSNAPVSVSVYGLSGVASFAMPAGMGVEPGGLTRSSVYLAQIEGASMPVLFAARGEVVIKGISHAGEMNIFDRAGRRVGHVAVLRDSDTKLDVKGYSSGIYFYRTAGGEHHGSFLVP